MYKKKIKVNQNAQMKIIEGIYQGVYLTRIEDIAEDIIKIAVPIVQGQLVPINVGTKVEVLVLDYGKAYGFISEVVDRQAVPLPMLKIRFPQKVKKVQRRNFVRVESFLPVQYSDQNKIKQKKEVSIKTGKTADVSGGGLCLSTIEPVEHGQQLWLSLQLPNKCTIEAIGKVVRVSDRIVQGTEKRYYSAIQFVEIDERDRDKIISYIFQLQRELRKKGLV